jgi:hypothetical protein
MHLSQLLHSMEATHGGKPKRKQCEIGTPNTNEESRKQYERPWNIFSQSDVGGTVKRRRYAPVTAVDKPERMEATYFCNTSFTLHVVVHAFFTKTSCNIRQQLSCGPAGVPTPAAAARARTRTSAQLRPNSGAFLATCVV